MPTATAPSARILAKGVCKHCRPDLFPGGVNGYFNISTEHNFDFLRMLMPIEIDGTTYEHFEAVLIHPGHNRVIVLNTDNGPQPHACAPDGDYPTDPCFMVDVLETDHLTLTLAS